MLFERKNIEFKAKLSDEIYKEVIVFTNTDGCTIYIGVDDEGNMIEPENVDESYTCLTNGIRDEIQSDVIMFIVYQ